MKPLLLRGARCWDSGSVCKLFLHGLLLDPYRGHLLAGL